MLPYGGICRKVLHRITTISDPEYIVPHMRLLLAGAKYQIAGLDLSREAFTERMVCQNLGKLKIL